MVGQEKTGEGSEVGVRQLHAKLKEPPSKQIKRRVNSRGKLKGDAKMGRRVDLNHVTKVKHTGDHAGITHETYTEGEHQGEFKHYPRPGCKDCYGTGTAGWKRQVVDGKRVAIPLACACLFKKKSAVQARMIEKTPRVIRRTPPPSP